jgi:hypothetical protein
MTTLMSSRHHVHWTPETRLGRWAVVMAGLSLAGVVLLVLGFVTGVVEPADSYSDSRGQAVWGLLIWASAIAALVTGVVATMRAHERSWLVRGAVVIGLLPPVLLLSEIALGKF